MENHKCKLCYRSFSNGRALGGHMKSHMVHLPILPKPGMGPGFGSLSSSPTPSFSSDSEVVKGKLVDKLMKSCSNKRSFVSVQDRESETESCKNVTRRRSTRTRKPTSSIVKIHHQGYNLLYDDISSSTSDVTSEEDVAFCLMMMSRDTWSDNRNTYEYEYECERDNADNITPVSQRKKYKCDTCNKVFRSYQALGGHRASHKKTRVTIVENVAVVKAEEKKIHECPICFRVFASGQALGGHKRSHVIGNSEVFVQSPKNLIDLNLPAPIDDDDNDEEIATSAVFDGNL